MDNCSQKEAFLKACELSGIQPEYLSGAEVNKLTEKAEAYENTFLCFVNQYYLLLLTIPSLARSKTMSVFQIFVKGETEICSGFSEYNGSVKLYMGHMIVFEDLPVACQELLLNEGRKRKHKKAKRNRKFSPKGV